MHVFFELISVGYENTKYLTKLFVLRGLEWFVERCMAWRIIDGCKRRFSLA